jgi:hypothetical protein
MPFILETSCILAAYFKFLIRNSKNYCGNSALTSSTWKSKKNLSVERSFEIKRIRQRMKGVWARLEFRRDPYLSNFSLLFIIQTLCLSYFHIHIFIGCIFSLILLPYINSYETK